MSNKNEIENDEILNPLQDEIIKKEYTKEPEVVGINKKNSVPEFIPEPETIFIEKEKQTNNEDDDDNNDGKGKKRKISNVSSKKLAEICVRAYEMLKTLSYNVVSLDEEHLKVKALKGKFDLSILDYELQISETDTITVKEFIEQYERGVKNALSIDEEGRCRLDEPFRTELLNLLIEIFDTQGVGLSPVGELLVLLGMDIIQTGAEVIQLRSMTMKVLKAIKEEKDKISNEVSHTIIDENERQLNNNIINPDEVVKDEIKEKVEKIKKRGRPKKEKIQPQMQFEIQDNKNIIETTN